MASIKCNVCRQTKPEKDFIKNGKTLKSCIGCRDKVKKKDIVEPAAPKDVIKIDDMLKNMSLNPITAENKIVPSIQLNHPTISPAASQIPSRKPLILRKRPWILLSGIWIKKGDERMLHKNLTKKLNKEFTSRSAFACHKFLTRIIMADIRDR